MFYSFPTLYEPNLLEVETMRSIEVAELTDTPCTMAKNIMASILASIPFIKDS